MAAKVSKVVLPELGRKGAYVLRNRVALLKSTQQVLADIGPEATIDQIADHAQMSVSTIYKHFENKESLFAAAIGASFADWESWKNEITKNLKDELEQLVIPMRLLLRLGSSHPHYAQMVAKNFESVAMIIPTLGNELALHVNRLVKAKVLQIDNVPLRIANLSAILAAALRSRLLDPKFSAADAEGSIKIGLEMLGLSEAKLKKLFDQKLPI
jgi:AcrR family transcriptional regulator